MDGYISGGNLGQTAEYLNAIALGDSTTGRYYLLQRDYFANEGDIDGDDDLKALGPLIMAYRCDLGLVALHKDAVEGLMVLACANVQIDQKGRISDLTESYGYKLTTFGNYSQGEISKHKYIMTKENTILLPLNTMKLPLMWLVEPVLKRMDLYLTANEINAITSITKKFKISMNNSVDKIKEWEYKSLFDYRNPLVYQITTPKSVFGNTAMGSGYESLKQTQDLSQPNLIEPMENANSSLLDGGDAFASDLGFGYAHLGRVHNVNQKSERLIVGENNNANQSICIVSNERNKFLKKFVEDINKVFAISVQLKEVAPVQQETSGNKAEGDENGYSANIPKVK